jgi:hypothetical protein
LEKTSHSETPDPWTRFGKLVNGNARIANKSKAIAIGVGMDIGARTQAHARSPKIVIMTIVEGLFELI